MRIHASCFVVARLGLVTWFGGFIGSCVVLSKSGICGVEKEVVCNTRVLGVVVSVLGL